MSPKEDDRVPRPRRWREHSEESNFFGQDRKSEKYARKLASAKDRSKYKKTDLRKQSKSKEIKSINEELERGRVLSIASQGIFVDIRGEIVTCTLRGVLKKDKTLAKNLIVVGDFVRFERTSTGEGLIEHIEPRRSLLSRAENLSRKKEQLIAANIDQVLITVSVALPALKPSLVDRYIIAAQKGDMEPIIVINKIDLLESEDEDKATLEQERALYDEMLKAYQIAGIPVISVSTKTGQGIDLLKEAMKDKVSVFSGQSGVGKSSLINAMTGHELRVGELVEKTQKGSHTTTTAHLIPLEFGGWCIDTPGIKSFGVWNLDKEEVEHHFPEIFTCGHQCRFPDCSHTGEEECAVIDAVEKGKISPLRYESYCALMQSISRDHFRR